MGGGGSRCEVGARKENIPYGFFFFFFLICNLYVTRRTIGSLLIFYDFFYKIVFTVLPVHVTIYPGTVRVRYLHESSQFMEIRYGA